MDNVFNNECLWIPIIVWFIIQSYKVVSELIINKKLDIRRFVGAGGMPSSHSAVVCSLAVMVGKSLGFDSAEFALALGFAGIVMYDAAGVRRAAGKQASILNKIIATPGMTTLEVQGKLVEALGHTPIQVLAGALIGIVVGFIF